MIFFLPSQFFVGFICIFILSFLYQIIFQTENNSIQEVISRRTAVILMKVFFLIYEKFQSTFCVHMYFIVLKNGFYSWIDFFLWCEERLKKLSSLLERKKTFFLFPYLCCQKFACNPFHCYIIIYVEDSCRLLFGQ